MAPRKTKQPLEPSAAAPADVKNASRRSSSKARPVGSSRTQIKVTFLDPLPTRVSSLTS
jgi:hypothetical protein